jgi:CubicO group peptidase (beta-lactamase class C family)
MVSMRIRRVGSTLVALTLSMRLAGPSAVVADEKSAAIDRYVEAEMARQRIPGLALAVSQRGRPVHVRGYGLANVEHQVPVTDRTVFQSGSVGKQFTAAAVMLLVEDGRLGLDDPIVTFFDDAPASWSPITVRHLLTHTSGIANYTSGAIDYRRDYTYPELVALAQKPPLDFLPGEKHSYSNTGYLLLGLIIEKVSGQFYGDLLRDRVFRPLGMDTARVISEADIVPHRAAGYEMVKGELKNQEWVAPSLNTTADGSLYLTVRDLARWDEALAARRLFKPSTYEAMWTAARLNDGSREPYGFGWRVAETNGHKTIAHGGAWQGFLSRIARYEDDGLTVIVLVNTSLANLERLERGVAGLFVPDLAPEPVSPVLDTDPSVTARVRALVEGIRAGTVTGDAFAPGLRADMTKEGLSSLKRQLEEPGTWRALELVKRTDDKGVARYRYRLDYGGPTLLVDVAFDSSDRVSLFDMAFD